MKLISRITNKKTNYERGFTAVETFFSISIFIIILLALTMLSRNVWIFNSFISDGLAGVSEGRKAIKIMLAEIRTASSAETGAYAINQASDTSFTFFADIDDDGLKDQIRYFLSGTNLQRGVVAPTGSPLTYNQANEKISTLLSNVTSASVFSYYDGNYDGTTAAIPTPVDISLIRLVKINISTDKNPNRPPAPNNFFGQVTIRNLKDNL